MVDNGILDAVPLWILFPLTGIVVLACVEIGFRIAAHSTNQKKLEEIDTVSLAARSVLGLLAFMLAFTFNTAGGRFQERRDILIADANAIGTTYLRSSLLPEPERTQIRQLLREYVDNRLNIGSMQEMNGRMLKSEELKTSLWKQEESAVTKASSQVTILFTNALNSMIDLDTTRTTVIFQHRLPDAIWAALIVLTTFGVGGLGYQSGLKTSRRSWAVVVLAMAFTMVFLLIAVLDRPVPGILTIDQTAMSKLQDSMTDQP